MDTPFLSASCKDYLIGIEGSMVKTTDLTRVGHVDHREDTKSSMR